MSSDVSFGGLYASRGLNVVGFRNVWLSVLAAESRLPYPSHPHSYTAPSPIPGVLAMWVLSPLFTLVAISVKIFYIAALVLG